MRISRGIVQCVAAAMLLISNALQPQPSAAASTITVAVNVTLGGAPLPGAFVALVPAGADTTGEFGGITAKDGILSIASVAPGSYRVSASSPGLTLGQSVITITTDAASVRAVQVDGIVTATLELTRTGSRLAALDAYGAQVGTIVADGKSGVFYLNTTGVPSFYRTGDYGGHWAPVTLRVDDESRGLIGDSVGSPAASGYPGEIAAIGAGKVFYSRDFGNTWASFSAPMMASPVLMWGHVGATSVLFAAEAAPGTRLFYTVMPTSTASTPPAGMTELAPPDNFRQSSGDRLHLANGASQPILAVAAGAGSSVTLYEIALSGSGINGRTSAVSSTLSGFPAFAPTFVRIGGPASGASLGAGNTPDTVLVYSNNATPAATAAMAVHSSGVWTTTTSVEFRQQGNDSVDPSGSFNSGGSSCGGQPGSIGSLAPAQSGVGSVSQCWVVKDGATLVVRFVAGINNNTGFAFDAGYDGGANQVIISGDGSKGTVKSAWQNPGLNRPQFPGWPQLAGSGTLTNSGGLSLRGVRSPVVRDTAFGPTASDLVIVFSFTGGGRVVGSNDGGATFFDLPQLAAPHAPPPGPPCARHCASELAVTPSPGLVQNGGLAVDWWRGAGDTPWLLANVGNGGAAMWLTSTAQLTETSVLVALNGSNIFTSIVPVSLVGLSGHDRAFVGLGDRGDNPGSYGAGGLMQVSITGTAAAYTGSFSLVPGLTQGVPALDYCAVLSATTTTSDTLFAAIAATTDNGTNGTIARFSSASATPVAESVTVAGANFREVRAGCASGTVWAGAYVNSGTGLFKSTDGGATFAQLSTLAWTTDTVPSPGISNTLRNIETLAVDANDNNTVIAVSKDGDVIATNNGGATWFIINDAASPRGRRFGSERPGDVEIPPASTGALAAKSTRAALGASNAMFGSSAGLFTTLVSWSSSVGGNTGGGNTGGGFRIFLPLAQRL